MNDDPIYGGDALDGSFWPAFADNMLALVFVLVLVIFLVAVGMQAGSVGVAEILEHQYRVASGIAEEYGGELISFGANRHEICADNDCPIVVFNDIQLQRITFSDRILFATGRSELSEQGRAVLDDVGRVVESNLGSIYKIQIEGHTDTVPATQYRGGNLELGALRAIAVYRFLVEEVGIDPSEHLISATSFGEYSPSNRADTTSFDRGMLEAANADEQVRRRNRRVELLLFYKRQGVFSRGVDYSV